MNFEKGNMSEILCNIAKEKRQTALFKKVMIFECRCYHRNCLFHAVHQFIEWFIQNCNEYSKGDKYHTNGRKHICVFR